MRFEVLRAMAVKNAVFRAVAPCDVCQNRRFRRTYRSVIQFLVTSKVVLSSAIPFILMMEAIPYSETWALTRATRCDVPEDGSHQ
jgi:hypothetical protein